MGSTDENLGDLNDCVPSSVGPRGLAQRVRDPLHATVPYDRLAAYCRLMGWTSPGS